MQYIEMRFYLNPKTEEYIKEIAEQIKDHLYDEDEGYDVIEDITYEIKEKEND